MFYTIITHFLTSYGINIVPMFVLLIIWECFDENESKSNIDPFDNKLLMIKYEIDTDFCSLGII